MQLFVESHAQLQSAVALLRVVFDDDNNIVLYRTPYKNGPRCLV